MITPIVVALLIVNAALIGYLSQVTGLCLVRGVYDWQNGKRLRLLAILSCGFWVYLYLPFVSQVSGAQALQVPALHWGFAVGGLLFGVGAAINGACSISTATRLASGDMAMLLTMLGWPAGWALVVLSGIQVTHTTHGFQPGWSCAFIVVGLLVVALMVHWKAPQRWRLWWGISLVGVLSGILFLFQPNWSPSDFVRDVALSATHADKTRLPIPERILILATMLLGMFAGAWKYGRFHWAWPTILAARRHFPAGLFMGAGSALALGGNDFQILLGLPGLSIAALTATVGMLLGIGVTMTLKRRLQH